MDIVAMKAAALPAHIKAALNSKEIDSVTHLLVKSKLKCGKLPMTLAEFDENLTDSCLSIREKIELKGTMSRAGLLV